MRRVLIGGLLLIVVAVGGIVFYFDRIATTAIEEGGRYALGVETRLSSFLVRPISGKVRIGGLSIANPSGFDQKHFLQIGSGRAQTSLKALRGDPIVIEQIVLQDVELALEREKGRTNYAVILDHLASIQGKSPPDEEGRGVVIRELLIRDINAHVDLVSGKLLSQDVVIPEIRLENVGDENAEGMQASELVGLITRAVLLSVAKKSGGLTGDLTKRLGRAGSIAGILIEAGTDDAGEPVEQLGKAVEKTLDGLGNFFKKKN
jgi:hypothetical protein